ncbi:MAG TPA: acyl-CoA reductase [Myxococcota bacterium]
MRAASSAEELRAASARLREAGAALRRRPRAEIVAVLGALLERLRDPASAIRAQLAAELPAATGFHPATLAAGLEVGFAPWSAATLAALVEREAPVSAQRAVSGFSLTAVVLGGAIPMPSVIQLIAPLALGSPVLVRSGSHDPVTARAVAAELARLDPGVGRCVELAAFARADAAALEAFVGAECVVATGSDDAVAAIAAHVRPWQRFVGYGHRFSVAALGRDGDLAASCAALARDVALWDQLGCLSPVALAAIGWRWAERAPLLDALEAAFAAQQRAFPLGAIAPHAEGSRANAIATFELRAAASDEAELRRDPRGGWALLAERDRTFRSSPLHRVLPVQFLPDSAALEAWLRPLAHQLASAGLGGFPAMKNRELGSLLADFGASRVCRLGAMQAPPISWSHDGQGVLTPLARFSDLELAAE